MPIQYPPAAIDYSLPIPKYTEAELAKCTSAYSPAALLEFEYFDLQLVEGYLGGTDLYSALKTISLGVDFIWAIDVLNILHSAKFLTNLIVKHEGALPPSKYITEETVFSGYGSREFGYTLYEESNAPKKNEIRKLAKENFYKNGIFEKYLSVLFDASIFWDSAIESVKYDVEKEKSNFSRLIDEIDGQKSQFERQAAVEEEFLDRKQANIERWQMRDFVVSRGILHTNEYYLNNPFTEEQISILSWRRPNRVRILDRHFCHF